MHNSDIIYNMQPSKIVFFLLRLGWVVLIYQKCPMSSSLESKVERNNPAAIKVTTLRKLFVTIQSITQ